MQEIRDGVDTHGDNQRRFGFDKVIKDSEIARRIAKIFVFRLIYGGSAWSYALDPDFNWISDDPDYWQGIIDEFYNKYQGIKGWHDQIVQSAMRTGQLVMPTGRVYKYQPYWKNNQWKWPRTTILNYPVQGLGADLMAIARVSARRRLAAFEGVLFINTVHDSILLDIHKELCYNVCEILDKVFQDIPMNFEKLFKVEFNLPMKAAIKYGDNWLKMDKWVKDDNNRNSES